MNTTSRRNAMDEFMQQIWKTFHDRLYKFIVVRVADENDAQDIVQEVFIRIYKGIDTLNDRDKLVSWIFQIARNAIIDYYRAKKKIEIITEDIPEIDEPEEVIHSFTPSLEKMIEHLPPIYKQAIRMTEYEGKTQKELSETLGISLTGAKSRVQRARQQLKEMLLDCCNFEFDSAGKMSDFSQKHHCCKNFKELRLNNTSSEQCRDSRSCE